MPEGGFTNFGWVPGPPGKDADLDDILEGPNIEISREDEGRRIRISAVPSGHDTEIQYNHRGRFEASSRLRWIEDGTDVLYVGGNIDITGNYLKNGVPIGVPAPPDRSVQFNNNGAFAGNPGFRWLTPGFLEVQSTITVTSQTSSISPVPSLIFQLDPAGSGGNGWGKINVANVGYTPSIPQMLTIHGNPLGINTGINTPVAAPFNANWWDAHVVIGGASSSGYSQNITLSATTATGGVTDANNMALGRINFANRVITADEKRIAVIEAGTSQAINSGYISLQIANAGVMSEGMRMSQYNATLFCTNLAGPSPRRLGVEAYSTFADTPFFIEGLASNSELNLRNNVNTWFFRNENPLSAYSGFFQFGVVSGVGILRIAPDTGFIAVLPPAGYIAQYALDVNGDINCTGPYRNDGTPGLTREVTFASGDDFITLQFKGGILVGYFTSEL